MAITSKAYIVHEKFICLEESWDGKLKEVQYLRASSIDTLAKDTANSVTIINANGVKCLTHNSPETIMGLVNSIENHNDTPKANGHYHD